jgi:hypothetical protein
MGSDHDLFAKNVGFFDAAHQKAAIGGHSPDSRYAGMVNSTASRGFSGRQFPTSP